MQATETVIAEPLLVAGEKTQPAALPVFEKSVDVRPSIRSEKFTMKVDASEPAVFAPADQMTLGATVSIVTEAAESGSPETTLPARSIAEPEVPNCTTMVPSPAQSTSTSTEVPVEAEGVNVHPGAEPI